MLVDVYQTYSSMHVLYELLGERKPEESISHKRMPTWEEHCDFVRSRPYTAWYIIDIDSEPVGAVYLSRQREVGIGIFKRHRGKGYAKQAITELLEKYPGKVYANINPANGPSISLFRSLNFQGPIQVTLERDCSSPPNSQPHTSDPSGEHSRS